MNKRDAKERKTLSYEITRFKSGEFVTEKDDVICEKPLEIVVRHGKPSLRKSFSLAITMRTPGEDFDLVRGYLFAESVIQKIEDIVQLKRTSEHRIVAELSSTIYLDEKKLYRNTTTTSSCGSCGKTQLEQIYLHVPYVLSSAQMLLSVKEIGAWHRQLQEGQPLFKATGGNHAIGYVEKGLVQMVCEDVGRHNAMDKLIGHLLTQKEVPFSKGAVIVSGRASFELVQKALMAGISVLAAVGAPSSLAIEIAQDHGLTLIGFLKEDQFNAYSCAERISAENDF